MYCRRNCLTLRRMLSSRTTSEKRPPATETAVGRAKQLKFSESGAYGGVDRMARPQDTVTFEPSASALYKRHTIVSFWSSLAVLCLYFWYSRRDEVSILDTPRHVIVPTLKRYALRQQIERARSNEKDTTFLEASLAYVDVEEAVLKAEDDGLI